MSKKYNFKNIEHRWFIHRHPMVYFNGNEIQTVTPTKKSYKYEERKHREVEVEYEPYSLDNLVPQYSHEGLICVVGYKHHIHKDSAFCYMYGADYLSVKIYTNTPKGAPILLFYTVKDCFLNGMVNEHEFIRAEIADWIWRESTYMGFNMKGLTDKFFRKFIYRKDDVNHEALNVEFLSKLLENGITI